MKCPHDSSRWELSGGELTGFGRDSGDGGVFGLASERTADATSGYFYDHANTGMLYYQLPVVAVSVESHCVVGLQLGSNLFIGSQFGPQCIYLLQKKVSCVLCLALFANPPC